MNTQSKAISNPTFLLDGSIRADYSLRMDDDSMIEAGIGEGDFALIEKTSEISDGKIFAVVAPGSDLAILRRVHKTESGAIELRAENPAYPSTVLDPDQVEIIGRLTYVCHKATNEVESDGDSNRAKTDVDMIELWEKWLESRTSNTTNGKRDIAEKTAEFLGHYKNVTKADGEHMTPNDLLVSMYVAFAGGVETALDLMSADKAKNGGEE